MWTWKTHDITNFFIPSNLFKTQWVTTGSECWKQPCQIRNPIGGVTDQQLWISTKSPNVSHRNQFLLAYYITLTRTQRKKNWAFSKQMPQANQYVLMWFISLENRVWFIYFFFQFLGTHCQTSALHSWAVILTILTKKMEEKNRCWKVHGDVNQLRVALVLTWRGSHLENVFLA